MRKKVMAVAIAGALTAPGVALAQTSTVQVFGTIHVIYDRQSSFAAANGPVPNVDHLTQSDSELGFRGEEALGGGLAAWFQCASTFDMVGTNANAAAPTAAWCGRNSAIGLKGGFGNIFWGIWDTPEKLFIGPIRGWFGFANVLGGLGLTENNSQSGVFNPTVGAAGVATNAGYARRQNRLISYHSPSFSGFQVLGAYSVANEATVTTSGAVANKPRLWSFSGTYTAGPIYGGVSYEKHHNYNPGVGIAVPAPNAAGVVVCTLSTATAAGSYCGGNDSKWAIGGAYTFGDFIKVSGIYNWFKYHPTVNTDMKVRTWNLYVDWTVAGPHSLKGAFSKVQDTKGTFGGLGAATPSLVGAFTANGGAGSTGAKQYNFAYAYAFSKRTTGYVGYARIKNDSLSAIVLPGGPRAVSIGEDQTAYGLGIRHSF